MNQTEVKKKLPKEDTYFIVFGKNNTPKLVEQLVEHYEMPDEEVSWLLNIAVELNCNTLFWRGDRDCFNYVHGYGSFLEYCWLSHNQPNVIVFEEGRGFYDFYTDKINTSVFYELERSLDAESRGEILDICKNQ